MPELIYKLQMHVTPTWIHIQIYRIRMTVEIMPARPVFLVITTLQLASMKCTLECPANL